MFCVSSAFIVVRLALLPHFAVWAFRPHVLPSMLYFLRSSAFVFVSFVFVVVRTACHPYFDVVCASSSVNVFRVAFRPQFVVLRRPHFFASDMYL